MDSDRPSDETAPAISTSEAQPTEVGLAQSPNADQANASHNVTSEPADAGQPAPLRENMISTAIKFLQNPQVQSSPLSQRRAFLKKKGLTDDEIKAAIGRSGVTEPTPVPQGQQPLTQPPGPPNQTAVVPRPAAPPPPPRTIYSRARDFTAVAVIISGVTYGLYKLFQKFIRSFFKRQGESERRLQNIEYSLAQVNDTLTVAVQEIQKSVGLIQISIEKQEKQLEQVSRDITASRVLAPVRGEGDVTQIKQEISSLKGLMLNRHQFPSTPQQSSIPAWQMESSTPSQEPQPADVAGIGESGSGGEDVAAKKDVLEGVSADGGGDFDEEDGEESFNGTNGVLGVNGGQDGPASGHPLKKSMLENSFSEEADSSQRGAGEVRSPLEGNAEID